MIALRVPQMALEREEAKILAEAMANVAQHYDFLENVLSEKSAAWLGLGQALVGVYGMRLMAMKIESNNSPPKDNVIGFPANLMQ